MFTSRARMLPLVLASSLGLAALTGCGSSGDAAADGRTDVVASFYPLAFLAERVGGPDVSVTTLTRPGAEPHDLELTPKQVGRVGRADLALFIKGVQPAVDDAVAKHAKDAAFDAASHVKLIPAPAEDEHEHEHGHEDEHGDEGHDHGEQDPHLWLDPDRMATVATALGERLAEDDAAHAAGYRARAAALSAELKKLDGAFAAGLKSCTRDTLVTAHAAFGYLADRYKLKQISIAGVDASSEPSPRRLAELTHQIKDAGATTVFTETLVSPKVAEALAREAGVKTAVLDPVEGVKEGSRDDYLSLMRANLAAIKPALGCS